MTRSNLLHSDFDKNNEIHSEIDSAAVIFDVVFQTSDSC